MYHVFIMNIIAFLPYLQEVIYEDPLECVQR
jgi:hypothetical protein